MTVLRSRSSPLFTYVPAFLTWRNSGFRSICSGHLGIQSSSPFDSVKAVTGEKVLESFKEEIEIASRLISFETGKIARFANGAVVMSMEETGVLSTVASSRGDGVRDVLPLT